MVWDAHVGGGFVAIVVGTRDVMSTIFVAIIVVFLSTAFSHISTVSVARDMMLTENLNAVLWVGEGSEDPGRVGCKMYTRRFITRANKA